MTISAAIIPNAPEWQNLEQLKREKEVVGIYLSGHPLDDFKKEMHWFTNGVLANLKDLKPLINKNINVAGIINEVEFLESKSGKQWGKFTLEDFSEQYEFKIFGEELRFSMYGLRVYQCSVHTHTHTKQQQQKHTSSNNNHSKRVISILLRQNNCI